MANSNEHIEEFLNYYLEKEASPDYAVLITGCWGSGKTYFIKQFLAGKDPNGKNKDVVKISDWLTDCEKYAVVYVSLFGAKSRAEMDQRVLEKLHPILNSELLKTIPGAVSLIGKILGVISSNPAGVVVGAAGDAGAFAANKIIEAFKQKSKKFEKIVIVFDDVERADMPLPELLGYLNAYVEHLHVPCILLADKEKWEEAQKCQEDKSTLHKLSSTKEKVVGKEFQIQTTFDEVWNHWKEDEHHPVGDRAWKILNDCRDLIKNIVESSSDYNYRALKHSLSDFQRFIGEKRRDLSGQNCLLMTSILNIWNLQSWSLRILFAINTPSMLLC